MAALRRGGGQGAPHGARLRREEIMASWRRVFRLHLRKGTVEQDVDDEIAFHLEMRARELIADGMEPPAAREEALRRFGEVERVRRPLPGDRPPAPRGAGDGPRSSRSCGRTPSSPAPAPQGAGLHPGRHPHPGARGSAPRRPSSACSTPSCCGRCRSPHPERIVHALADRPRGRPLDLRRQLPGLSREAAGRFARLAATTTQLQPGRRRRAGAGDRRPRLGGLFRRRSASGRSSAGLRPPATTAPAATGSWCSPHRLWRERFARRSPGGRPRPSAQRRRSTR